MADVRLSVSEKKEVPIKGEATSTRPVFMPPVDIYEVDDSLVLLADVPGVKEADLDIHLEDNTLSISGKVTMPVEAEEAITTEFRVGDYFRRFTISNIIDQSKISATLNDGVLKIVLPKAEASKPKKIPVTTG